jgi:response regulator RpfG family c-di-GMP phosphodiesterase
MTRANSSKHFDPERVEGFLQKLPDIVEIRERFAEPDAPA